MGKGKKEREGRKRITYVSLKLHGWNQREGRLAGGWGSGEVWYCLACGGE